MYVDQIIAIHVRSLWQGDVFSCVCLSVCQPIDGPRGAFYGPWLPPYHVGIPMTSFGPVHKRSLGLC